MLSFFHLRAKSIMSLLRLQAYKCTFQAFWLHTALSCQTWAGNSMRSTSWVFLNSIFHVALNIHCQDRGCVTDFTSALPSRYFYWHVQKAKFNDILNSQNVSFRSVEKNFGIPIYHIDLRFIPSRLQVSQLFHTAFSFFRFYFKIIQPECKDSEKSKYVQTILFL